MSGLKRLATVSALWAAIETGTVSVFSVAVLLTLAHFLTPADFGTAAIALAIVQIMAVVGEFLFHDAVVHRPDLTPEQTDSAHTVTVIVGAALTALVMLTAPLLDRLFAVEGLGNVLFWMAPSIFFTAWGAVPVAMLRRNLEMRSVALRMMVGRLLGGAAAIVAAFAGMGLWAIVMQQVAMTAFGSLVLLLLGSTNATRLPRFGSLHASFPLLRFGLTSLMVNMMWGSISKVFVLACSFVLTPAGVGVIAMAMRLVDTLAAVVSGAQSKVALSLFARVHRETGTVRNAYIAGVRLSAYIIVPMFAGLAAAAHDIVLAMAGEQWLDAVPLVEVLATAQAIRFLLIGGALLTAIGRPSDNLLIAFTDLLSALIVLALLGPFGVFWAGIAWVSGLVVTMPLSAYLLRRHAGIGLDDMVRGTYRAVLASLVMVAAVLVANQALAAIDLWFRLPLTVLIGALVYAAVIWCIDRELYAMPRQLLAGKT